MKVKTMTVRYVPADRGISRINIGQNSERLINSCRSDKVRSLHELRKFCTHEVRRLNGRYRFEDAVDYQNS